MDCIEPERSESLFSLVFDKNPQPMWFFDTLSLKFLEVNDAAVAQYGYSRKEFSEMTIRDIRPKEDLEYLDDVLKIIRGPVTSKRNFRHLLKNGSVKHVQVVSYPAEYKGYFSRLVMVNDVTESVLHIERFDLISKATHDAVWDWNLENDELWWNESFLTLFNYRPEEIEQTIDSWTTRIHPDDRERVINSIHHAIQTGEKNWQDEYRFLRGDGAYAHVLDRAYTIFKDGKAVRMLGSMMDTTIQIQLQQAREETESILQTITSASPTALWMADANGDVVYVNQKWLDWSNSDFGESINDGWLKAIHADDRNRVKETFNKAYDYKAPYEIDYRILFKDGSVRWITATGLPRYNTDKVFIGFVGSCTDITKQKYLEQQKDSFITTVSHELKTPIASIKGYEQLLNRTKAVKDPQGQGFLNRMRVQINRLDSLVQDLLDISRIESGKLTFKDSEFEVNVLMAELISDLQLVFPSHRLIVTENQSCKIFADKNRVIQLITNLVDNAVKYSPQGDKVNMTLTCDEKFLTVSVQDFGKGISKEQEAYIFERFYQVNDVYKAPGLGIGLYISKEIVLRLNGEIWFESNIGHGTTFYFKIPRKLD